MLIPGSGAVDLHREPGVTPRTSREVGADTTPRLRDHLTRAWEGIGRRTLSVNAGMTWDTTAGLWRIDRSWRYADSATAPLAYYLEHALRPAITVAEDAPDPTRLDELAQFLVAYHERFVTLGSLRARASASRLPSLLEGQGPDSTLTLAWLQSDGEVTRWRECPLCNAQFLHPAARLLRIIAETPSARSAAELRFARLYVPLIAQDHLVRLGFVAQWSFPDRRLPRTLVGAWERLATLRPATGHAYYDAVQDRDLWLIATAAELLGAARADPKLVPLEATTRTQLHRLVDSGIALVVSRRHHRVLRRPDGPAIVTDSYFDGDFDDHPDIRFAGDSSASRPLLPHPPAPQKVSWDISHIYRLPVLFRSLIDNRTAIGNKFPTHEDVTRLTNQYVYGVFHGVKAHPLPTNFFDGSDGWYRVGPRGGYPPSRDCDSRTRDRPCLSAEAALYGWELLARNASALQQLDAVLLQMARSSDPATIAFRRRHYTQGTRDFVLPVTVGARAEYSMAIYTILSGELDTAR